MSSPSRFGDVRLGRYNVLPKDTGAVRYRAPETVLMRQFPHIANTATSYSMAHWDYETVDPAWDVDVTEDAVADDCTAQDALARVADQAAEGWWAGYRPDRSNTTVHTSWDERPVAGFWADSGKFDSLGRKGQAAHLTCEATGTVPMAFVGTLCAVAPLVCTTLPLPGEHRRTFTTTFAVSVTESTRSTTRHGLRVHAGLSAEGAEGGIAGAVRWTTNSGTTIRESDGTGESHTLVVPEDVVGRLDTRLCAGLYAGWIIYQGFRRDSRFGMYPTRVPVHVPELTTPVTVHTMHAPLDAFGPGFADLLREYDRAERELVRAREGAPTPPEAPDGATSVTVPDEHLAAALLRVHAIRQRIDTGTWGDADVPAQARPADAVPTPV